MIFFFLMERQHFEIFNESNMLIQHLDFIRYTARHFRPPVKPNEASKHAFCFSHLPGVKVELDVTNGKEVLQMSH